MEHRGKYLGVLFALLAATQFGAIDLGVKLWKPYLNVWNIMLARSIFGVVVISILTRLLGLDLLGRNRPLLVLAGLTGVGAIVCLTISIFLLPLFVALALMYLYPAFAALVSPVLTGEKTTPFEWLLIGLTFAGTVLMLWSGPIGVQLQWGHVAAIAGAFEYGLTITLIRRVRVENNPMVPLFYMCAVGCIACIGPTFWQEKPFPVEAQGLGGLTALAILGVGAHLATNKALGFLSSPKVGVVCMLEVVIGGIGGYLIFDEPLFWHSMLGAAMILGCGIMLNLRLEVPTQI